jgi:hypothetical protein
MNYYIIGSVALFIIVFIFVYFFLLNPSSGGISVVNTTAEGPFSLLSKTSVIKPSDFPSAQASYSFLKGGEGTFSAYIFLDSLKQTSSLSSCGTRPNQPSCSSGMYDPCKCRSLVDCNNCSHDGYKNLVSLYGVYNIEVLPFPDASRQNTVSTQLVVQTQTAEESFIETIPLPPIPLQKWIFITLSKVGRRIDIYYNDSIVISKTLLNMTSTFNPSGSIVQAGDSGLSGTIALISISDVSTRISSVAAKYSEISDTRGAPTKFAVSLQSHTNSIHPVVAVGVMNALCLNGSCLRMPRVGNVNPTLSQFTDNLDGLSNSSTSSTISPAFNVNTAYG